MAHKHTISTDRSIVAYNPRTAAERSFTDDSDLYVMKASIASTCTLIPDTQPKIYQLPLTEIAIDTNHRLRKIVIGKENVTTATKTILLLGGTGVGKSTLINALVNYILNVKWEDDFRFILINELNQANPTSSQTEWVTIYTMYHQNNFRTPYNITIVDTPGFNATSGIERDKEICTQLEALFKSEGPVGLDSLDAVGFVVKSSDVKLTQTQRYIYDSVLTLFARDLENNIYMLITFSDGKMPPVLAAIKAHKIPHKGYVKMDNSALYADNRTSDDNVIFDRAYWGMGEKSYETFMVAVHGMEPMSLTLSHEVLLERHRLEKYVEALELEMTTAIQKSKQLIVEKEALSKFKQEGKNFSFDNEEFLSEKRNLLPGEAVTNCHTCQTTCCYPCNIKTKILGLKYFCAAMTWGANCMYCPGNCPTSAHTADNFRFVRKKVKVTKMLDDIRQRYEEAGVNKMTVDELLQKVENELKAIETQLSVRANVVQVSINRLQKIALKPNPFSTADYFDTLIEKEKREGGPDSAAIKILQAAKKKHLKFVKLSQTKGNITVDELSVLFEQARIESLSNGNSYQVAITSAAAKVKRRLAIMF